MITRTDDGGPAATTSVFSLAGGGVLINQDIDPPDTLSTGSWAATGRGRFTSTHWTGFPADESTGTPASTAWVRTRGRSNAARSPEHTTSRSSSCRPVRSCSSSRARTLAPDSHSDDTGGRGRRWRHRRSPTGAPARVWSAHGSSTEQIPPSASKRMRVDLRRRRGGAGPATHTRRTFTNPYAATPFMPRQRYRASSTRASPRPLASGPTPIRSAGKSPQGEHFHDTRTGIDETTKRTPALATAIAVSLLLTSVSGCADNGPGAATSSTVPGIGTAGTSPVSPSTANRQRPPPHPQQATRQRIRLPRPPPQPTTTTEPATTIDPACTQMQEPISSLSVDVAGQTRTALVHMPATPLQPNRVPSCSRSTARATAPEGSLSGTVLWNWPTAKDSS